MEADYEPEVEGHVTSVVKRSSGLMREEAWPDSSLQAPLYIYRIKAVTSVEVETSLDLEKVSD